MCINVSLFVSVCISVYRRVCLYVSPSITPHHSILQVSSGDEGTQA